MGQHAGLCELSCGWDCTIAHLQMFRLLLELRRLHTLDRDAMVFRPVNLPPA